MPDTSREKTSPLESLPSAGEIRQRIIRNGQENRTLRALLKIVARLESGSTRHDRATSHDERSAVTA